MARRKIFGIFDRRPSIWFHYVLLTGVLFLAFFSLNYFGFVEMNSSSVQPLGWFGLFLWYFAFISIGDQLIHYFLGVD